MQSFSSNTSIGKEQVPENTIEQILGNIERSTYVKAKERKTDECEQFNNFRRQIESGNLYTPEKQPIQVAVP